MSTALPLSAAVTLAALGAFGWAKGAFTGLVPPRGGAQTIVVGGPAAGIAYAIARLISSAGA